MNSIKVYIRSRAVDTAQVYGDAANTGSGAGKLITTSGSYNKFLEMI